MAELAYLCPMSQCPKNQRNGPCGGTRDGLCEVDHFECIWSRAYDRLKYEGREMEMLAHAPVIQDQGLRDTSSWANTWLGRDHSTQKQIVKSGAAPVSPFTKSKNVSEPASGSNPSPSEP